LLAAVVPEDTAAVLAALHTAGIAATWIGTVRAEPGVVLRSPAGERPLPRFARDELARLFGA